ncbi:MAG: PadR family transcriptional regulator [Anaerolinea sp.]|nr:PadR family transcriptional regulator [Anaerolinea sp.]
MSLKHAILGFLSFRPATGYDLKKAFDRSVSHFWPANQSQIYRTLAGLTEEGYVTQEIIEREERLDAKIYHITQNGRDELHRWLSTPLPPQPFREPFLIQVYFGGYLSDEELIALLARQIAVIEQTLAVYNQIYAMYQEQIESREDVRAFFLSVSTLEYGIVSNRAALAWLNSLIERVRSGNYAL